MKGIFFKNFIATAGMVLVSFLILSTAFILLGRTYLIKDKRDSLVVNAEEIARSASVFTYADGLYALDLRMLLASVARVSKNHIFICDENGYVISCSDMEIQCEHLGKRMNTTVINTVNTTGEYSNLTDLGGFYAAKHYVVAKPIYSWDGQALEGYVFVGSESSSVVDMLSTFYTAFFIVTIVTLTFAVFLSFVTSKQLAGPLREMAAAARRFAHGDFSVRVKDEMRDDEIGELTGAFNAMAESLERSEERRREFIANVSHELKTPMTSIAGFADGILDGTIPQHNQSKYLETISSETKRLSRLVRRMLEVSRIQSATASELKRTSFDVSELLRQTLLSFDVKISDKDLTVAVLLPEDAMYVLGDADSITQVVYNLLDNAIKFSIPGSELGLSLWKNGGKAYVSVKNQGNTIPEDELSLIFDRFHKTDRSRSLDRDGIGLGLYIVKSILNNHDEDISVSSRDGVTEFVFTLTLKL